MTEGVIWKQLLIFFFPVLLGSFFQQLYNMADAVIVGQFAGKGALAAVDAVGVFTKLFISLFTGVSSGATILLSQYYGGGKNQEMSRVVHTSVALALASGLVITAIGIVIAPFILQAINIPADIIDMALDYTRIYFTGMIPSLIYNVGAGILRAVGNSKSPFYFLVISSVVNVGLDLLFVGAFGWGVTGAAVATVVSQVASAALVVASLVSSETACHLDIRRIRFHGDMVKGIAKIGMPVGIQNCMYPLSNIFVSATVNSFQTDAIAAWAISGKTDAIIWLIIESSSIAISTFVAQNYGARRLDRVKQGLKYSMLLCSGLVLILSAVVFTWIKPLAGLFLDDAAVIDLSVPIVRFLVPFYVVFVWGDILGGCIRGTGESLAPMLITMLGTCALRVVWVQFIFPLNPEFFMIVAVYPVTWVVTSVAYIIYYQYYRRKRLVTMEAA